MSPELDRSSLAARIAAIPNWYHVMELAPGLLTPGDFDMRAHVGAYEFPENLSGVHVVDVGASNGFFSFELERRGARVVAVELASVRQHDVPIWFREQWLAQRDAAEVARTDHLELEAGFDLAHEVYGSRVERQRCTVYALGDASPGRFDLALCSNLLHHLRDPVGALESIRLCLRPGGRLILGCSCDLTVDASYAIFWGSVDPHVMWWVMSREAIERMCRMAGFREVVWKGSFRFATARRPDHVGTMGILHAVAP
ncbi:MAG: methyltransferase domain-containing protein [Planctomycetota bacterium]|nr:MAG: methyltransferase domain-containing protein [Planctomycetota bacterium]